MSLRARTKAAHGFGDSRFTLADVYRQNAAKVSNDVPRLAVPRNHAEKFRRPVTIKTLDALSPEMAAPYREQLVGLSPEARAELEPKLALQALQAASTEARIMIGVGSQASPLDKARVSIANQERQFERRVDQLAAEINEQTGTRAVYDRVTGLAVIDPATGLPKMEPIYALSKGIRDAKAAEMMGIVRQLSVLRGPGGDKELDAALKESVQLAKSRAQDRADLDEIERRARETIREEQIAARVDAKAKHLRAKSNYSGSL
ncbi:MAG: hypothetical protein DI569_02665 [Sphingopyxis macrogoltabida]|uniref:Uncharacterized protein n=1 Tax=Sphingopyxis macrogoltabida TaxID=33050 RepID=A0A2W5N1J6_SPHMC|nr:MAG: hypothetical protein DI569_02665 [Sphingopyxis macrogoltabida]